MGNENTSVGRVRRCGRCGDWTVDDSQDVWIDATEGDGCEDGVHFPAGDGAGLWTVVVESGSEQEEIECFGADADEAGRTAVRIAMGHDCESARHAQPRWPDRRHGV